MHITNTFTRQWIPMGFRLFSFIVLVTLVSASPSFATAQDKTSLSFDPLLLELLAGEAGEMRVYVETEILSIEHFIITIEHENGGIVDVKECGTVEPYKDACDVFDSQIEIVGMKTHSFSSSESPEDTVIKAAGDVVLATITFQAVGQPGDSTPLRIVASELYDVNGNPIDHTAVDGQVNIIQAPLPIAIGGIIVPANRLELLAPWLGLVGLVLATVSAMVVKRHRSV